MSKKDFSGMKYGYLTAIEEVEPWILPSGRKQRRYKCICKCGNECICRVNDLQSGKSTSCGCKRKETIHDVKIKDLVGMVFGDLTVLQYVNSDKRGKACWLCECTCGNKITVNSSSLVKSNTKSCGCRKHRKQHEDLTGQIFGDLTVISYAFTKKKFAYFKCKCSCGNICEVSSNSLKQGNARSCGHVKSRMEETVNSYLIENGYNFVLHKHFDDLKRIGFLEFDFAILDDRNELLCLIECQGEQHYKNVGSFGAVQRNETDQMKREYCEKNKINLFEIKYSDNIIESLVAILKKIHANPVPSLN